MNGLGHVGDQLRLRRGTGLATVGAMALALVLLAFLPQSGCAVGLTRVEAKAEIDKQYLSSDLAADLLGWRPAVELAGRLSETVEWYRDRFQETDGGSGQ